MLSLAFSYDSGRPGIPQDVRFAQKMPLERKMTKQFLKQANDNRIL
jgi:hypothetical protein